MKRRAISFIAALALCLSLCPMQAWAASTFTVTADKTVDETYTVTSALVFDTGGFTYTVTGKTAVSVKSGGVLQLASTGALESTGGAGVEVLSGGTLQATNSGLTVKGTTYGLDIASGAKKWSSPAAHSRARKPLFGRRTTITRRC